MLRRLTVGAALLAATASPALAQVQVGLSAFLGGYLPTSNLFDAVRVGGDTGQIILNLGQTPAVAVGGRLTVRVLKQLAIDGEVGYAFSALDVPAAVDPETETGSSVVMASLNAMWIFYEAPFSPMSLFLSAGVGLSARDGEFWTAWEGTSNVGATFGLGLRYGLTPLLGLRFDLRDYVYSFQPTVGNFTFDAKTQNDLVISVALDFAFTPVQ
jgi:hypothetical protein